MADPVCRLVLPIPPSTNNLFRGGARGGRYKTQAYKAWLTAAGWEVKLQRPPTLHPPLRTCLRVLVEAPFGPNREINDALLPLFHILVKMGVIEATILIDDLHIVRSKADASGAIASMCTVNLWPL